MHYRAISKPCAHIIGYNDCGACDYVEHNYEHRDDDHDDHNDHDDDDDLATNALRRPGRTKIGSDGAVAACRRWF